MAARYADRNAVVSRVEAYNRLATDANARAARIKADRETLTRETERYNLMLVYPDGQDAR